MGNPIKRRKLRKLEAYMASKKLEEQKEKLQQELLSDGKPKNIIKKMNNIQKI